MNKQGKNQRFGYVTVRDWTRRALYVSHHVHAVCRYITTDNTAILMAVRQGAMRPTHAATKYGTAVSGRHTSADSETHRELNQAAQT